MSEPVTRRTALRAVAVAGAAGVAGCSQLLADDDRPAGSLELSNEDDLPHQVTVVVEDVGTGLEDEALVGDPDVPDGQRDLRATAALGAGATDTWRSVFTESVWYRLSARVDGQPADERTGTVRFAPMHDDQPPGRVLVGRIGKDGRFGWTVTTTTNTGAFED